MDAKKVINEAGNIASEAWHGAVNDYSADIRNQTWKEATSYQKKMDVQAAVRAFVELKVKDQEIYQLLSKYFGVDSISEVNEYLFHAKKPRQIKALRQLCERQGMQMEQFRTYAKQHKLEERLKENPKLLELTPEKLKDLLDNE